MQSQKNRKLHFFLRIFDEFFSGFRAKFQKIVTCAAFSIKFAKTNQKFAENSEFCEKNSLFFKIIHFTPQRACFRRRGQGRGFLPVGRAAEFGRSQGPRIRVSGSSSRSERPR